MRVLVCGSRDFDDASTLFTVLDKVAAMVKVEAIIEGEAAGADRLARQWAQSRGVLYDPYPADWNNLGKMAGPLRNERMLREGKPNLVIAFPLAQSRGTWHMIGIAKRDGIKTWVMPRDIAEIDALGEGVHV